MARVRANLAALRTLRTLQAEDRPATVEEQARLARWSGWGAVPQVFDADRSDDAGEGAGGVEVDGDLDEEFVRARRGQDWSWARAELAELLDPTEYAAARRTTLNAHYTDAALVAAVWEGLARLGFTGGRVLEPGCGVGNFIGLAPASASMVGVEWDPVTAGIAAALYPDAQVLAESFADTRAREGTFDAVVGNVPFGRIVLHDPRHNSGGHSIHNHFIAKSLALTRPGGLVAVLTSRYTMDARNPAARREIAAMADLVGAIRLPTGAHRRAAGTTVVTDLLVLRRREVDRPADSTAWEQVRTVQVPGGEVEVNEYFVDHPDAVLGESVFATSTYRPDLVVRATGDVPSALAAALDRLGEHATERGLTVSERDQTARAVVGPLLEAASYARQGEGHIEANPLGGFTQICDGVPESFAVPASQAVELRALLVLRDTVMALLTAEATSREDTEEIGRLRADLNSRYDAYLAAYGPINRFKERNTGRVDPDTGEMRMARIQPRQGGFRDDPGSAAVYALEEFDPVDQRATKMAIFRQRVVAPRTPRLGADTPEDALAICLDTYAEVRLPEVARLLGIDVEQAREALGDLVFDEPGTNRVVLAAEYLSGNVRIKLEAAQAAAETDPRFERNVEALAGVLPPDLGVDRITAQLGAVWIDAEDVQGFLREILADPGLRVEHPGGAIWGVKGNKLGVLATSTWGTDRYAAPALAHAMLEQRSITVFDEYEVNGNKYRLVNLEETAAAQDKAREIAERFSEWVWEDSERTDRLVTEYNRRFNSVVGRTYDGAHLSLPGLAADFEPYPHQRAAVARIIHEPATLLAHAVGAGKTAEMIMGVMELRRLGIAGKTGIVVPNHMLEQFRTDFLRLYPQAKVLAAGTADLAGARRRQFVARAATGDWDAVILSRGAFERIPMSPESQHDYLDQELETIKGLATKSRALGGMTTKRLEAAVVRATERLKKETEKAHRDAGTVTFEQLGLGSLVVDELHYAKNLRTMSNIPGVAIDGSARASDLHMKVEYLRRKGPTRIIGATATPLANSISEMHTWQRMLRPDRLAEAGLTEFDAWAATFGQVVTAVELAPAGNKVRVHSRFARFQNVRALMVPWLELADIKTAEDLNLPRPVLRGGGPQIMLVPASPALQDYMEWLGARAEAMRGKRPEKGGDNMLKVSSDGAAASLDLRLVDQHTDPGWVTKIDLAAKNIHARWLAHRDDVYLAPDGREDPVRGSLQLVFCDLGTPSEEWNVYDQLRDQLVEMGMPGEQIRYIHQAKNDKEKAELFATARSGRIAVLMGSTGKMGEGTNVQRRAIALYHLDCPWRPLDLEQRDGRIWRQGNANPEVEIFRIVAEGSFDAYKYQANERKIGAFKQVMRSTLPDVDELDDISDEALDFAQVKAAAAGDPHLLDRAQAEADVNRLQRLERAWHREQDRLRRDVRTNTEEIGRLTSSIAQIDAAIARRHDTSGDAFTITLDGQRYDKRTAAGEALLGTLTRLAAVTPIRREGTPLGHLGGFDLTAYVSIWVEDGRGVRVHLDGLPEGQITLTGDDLATASAAGLITRLENRLGDLERQRAVAASAIEACRAEIERAQDRIGGSFGRHDQLLAARDRLEQLNSALTARAAEDAKDTAGGTPTGASTTASDDTPTASAQGAGITAGASPASTPAGTARREADQNTAALSRTSQAKPTGAASGLEHAESEPAASPPSDPETSAEDTSPPAESGPGQSPDGLGRAILNAAVDSGRVAIIPVGPPPTPGQTLSDQNRPDLDDTATVYPSLVRSDDDAVAPVDAREVIGEDPDGEGDRGRERDNPPPVHSSPAQQDTAGSNGAERETTTAGSAHARGGQTETPQEMGSGQSDIDTATTSPGEPQPQPVKTRPGDGNVGEDPPSGIRIEHGPQGTLVHGTSRTDTPVIDKLHTHGFRWSGRLGSWYLRRSWGLARRKAAVWALIGDLDRLGRIHTLVNTVDTRAEVSTEVMAGLDDPAALPYINFRELERDWWAALDPWIGVRRTQAGWRVSHNRADGQALAEAHEGMLKLEVRWLRAGGGGDPAEMVRQVRDFAAAATVLSTNLADEQYRAPVLRQQVDQMAAQARILATRIAATVARLPAGQWARALVTEPPPIPNPPEPAASTQTGTEPSSQPDAQADLFSTSIDGQDDAVAAPADTAVDHPAALVPAAGSPGEGERPEGDNEPPEAAGPPLRPGPDRQATPWVSTDSGPVSVSPTGPSPEEQPAASPPPTPTPVANAGPTAPAAGPSVEPMESAARLPHQVAAAEQDVPAGSTSTGAAGEGETAHQGDASDEALVSVKVTAKAGEADQLVVTGEASPVARAKAEVAQAVEQDHGVLGGQAGEDPKAAVVDGTGLDLGEQAVAHLRSPQDRAHAYWVWHRLHPFAQFEHNVTVAAERVSGEVRSVLARHVTGLRQDLVVIGQRAGEDYQRRAAATGRSQHAVEATWRGIAADPTYERQVGAAIERRQEQATNALRDAGLPAEAAGGFFAAVVGQQGPTGPVGADGRRVMARHGWAAMMPVSAAKAAAHTTLRTAAGDAEHARRLREVRAMLADRRADAAPVVRRAAAVATRVLTPAPVGGPPSEGGQGYGRGSAGGRASGLGRPARKTRT